MRSGVLARVLAAGLALAPVGAAAQDAEAQLNDLIPDAAVADPEGWAKNTPAGNAGAPVPPVAADPAMEVDPASPLAELPGFALPWPDTLGQPPALASLPPEPDVAAALAEAAANPLPPSAMQGEEIKVADHLTLVFPANLATFPERATFLDRFRALSTVRKLDTHKDSITQVAARARADRDLITRLLRIYGYYDAIVTQTVGNPDVKGGELVETAQNAQAQDIGVRFDVVPGDRYRFGAIDLGNLALAGPDYAPLRAGFGITTGDPLDNDRIVAGRDRLDTDLGEIGYAFAKVGAPELLVDHKREEGDLTVPVEPGGKYAFGHVVSGNPRFLSSRHLERIARFKAGDLYQRTEQEDLKRAILALVQTTRGAAVAQAHA